MNKPNEHKATHGPAKIGEPSAKPVPAGNARTFTAVESAKIHKPAEPAVVHQVTAREPLKEPVAATPAKAKLTTAELAGMGNPDPMNKQQQQSMPSVDELKGKWKQHMGAAKMRWGKLTDDELLTSEGHRQKIAGLVQQRYAVTRDEADKQVKHFFEKLDA
jgi:uncharacterized protein YjbJ (UPF0337 family)